jgi:hypothetical protein
MSLAQAIREVSCERGCCFALQQPSEAVTVTPVPACYGIALVANVPDRQRRDGRPQRVIRREDTVIPMPVLPRRRDEIGEPVEELKRRELGDAVRRRLRGLP